MIINEDRLFFGGEDGETITVTLKSLNTRHAVNAILDSAPEQMTSTGTQSSTLSFKLDMSKHDPSILLLFFQFFGAADAATATAARGCIGGGPAGPRRPGESGRGAA
jgi:hypothetical protein